MKFYEATYIVHSALQEGRLNDIIQSISKFLESIKGEIVFFDNWGRKKLSYLIDKQKYGTYIHIQFKIPDTNKIKELIAEFELNPNILRNLIVAINEDEVLTQSSKSDKNEKKEAVKKNDDAK